MSPLVLPSLSSSSPCHIQTLFISFHYTTLPPHHYLLFPPLKPTAPTMPSPIPLLLLLLLLLLPFHSLSSTTNSTISISGNAEDCDCQSPAPSPSPSPSPELFVNLKQYYAYFVIQRFKRTITCDPNGVISSWVGYRPCNYTGFFCDSPPNSPTTPTIASIDFNGFRLCAPSLSSFIDQLPDLALFHANSNNFSGSVPDLTSLAFLYELDLSNNNFSGPFPSNLLPLSNLAFLDLRFNHFIGAVPSQIFVYGYEALFLNNNAFDRSLPYNIGSSPALYLTFANNRFTGPIPRSIGNWSNTLQEVLFLNNRFTGCLPYEIGLLHDATVFDVGSNLLTGPIPFSFGCLRKVEELNLADNYLYGHVPDILCLLYKTGNLANLSLSGNFFTSIGLTCFDLVDNGVLDVRGNCILGLPEQRSVKECAWFLLDHIHCPLETYIPCKHERWMAAPPPPPLASSKHVGYKTHGK